VDCFPVIIEHVLYLANHEARLVAVDVSCEIVTRASMPDCFDFQREARPMLIIRKVFSSSFTISARGMPDGPNLVQCLQEASPAMSNAVEQR